MFIERFETQGLAHYSYAVGCEGAKSMAIIDPRRDGDVYLNFAQSHGWRITDILETHIHADYASGAVELAARSGAKLWSSAYDQNETYQTGFACQKMHDGDSLNIGNIKIEALHTPGHTPEHLSFLVYDLNRHRSVPQSMFSGDFIFVGSLGRPDLLGEAAKFQLAEKLFFSATEKIKHLPDGLEILPAHGAGSLCGAGMSARPSTTLGFERMANPYLRQGITKEEFVDRILGSVPEFPPYYLKMKQLNSLGAPHFSFQACARALDAEHFRRLADSGHLIIDTRDQLAFGGGHIPGSINLGAGANFVVWASWTLPYDRPLLLVADQRETVHEIAASLGRIGIDNLVGYMPMTDWQSMNFPLQTLAQVSVQHLHEQKQTMEILDVRSPNEFRQGHLPGSQHLPIGELVSKIDTLKFSGKRVAVICGTGYRSSLAASMLQTKGHSFVCNVTGGIHAWRQAGLPVSS